jgi:hypothetical protein
MKKAEPNYIQVPCTLIGEMSKDHAQSMMDCIRRTVEVETEITWIWVRSILDDVMVLEPWETGL